MLLTDVATPPPDACSSSAWYLIHTKPRQETIALANLQRQGYPCYLPQLRVERLRRRQAQWALEPMFARYLFVRLGNQSQDKSWSPIRSTVGVSQLVYLGSRAARVDDALVELLRQREQTHQPEPLFSPGERVLITHGPFVGIEAVYQLTDAQQRAMVLLQILSKTVTMHIAPGYLRSHPSPA